MSDDELDDLLTPTESAAIVARREAIFAKTLPLLRPGKVMRFAKLFALLAAGVAIGWFAKPTPPPERIVETVFEKVPVEVSSPGEMLVELTPDRLELEAEKATERTASAKLFQKAGDAYLKANEIESAIRCYRQYLAEAGADGRTVRDDDSWLLTSIKHSKRTENDHANAGS